MSFEEYVAERGPGLLRLAYLLCGDRDAAQDLLQTALVELYRNWGRVELARQPDAYVRRVLLNTLRSWQRRRSWWERPTATGVIPERSPEPTGPTLVARADGDPAGQVAERDVIWRLLGTLPLRSRAVLVLRFYEDADDATIGTLLGMAPSSVRVREPVPGESACRGVAGHHVGGVVNEIEEVLRAELAEHARDVTWDPDLVHRVARLAASTEPGRPARTPTRARPLLARRLTGPERSLLVAAAVIAVVAGVALVLRAVPDAAGPSSVAPVASSLSPTSSGVARPFATGSASGPRQELPPGPVPLTGAATTYRVPYPEGCAGMTIRKPAASFAVRQEPLPSPGPTNPQGAARRAPTADVQAVQADLQEVVDGQRFGGMTLDPSGTSITVYVVSGATEAASRAAALSCARDDVQVTVRTVTRSSDQLEGLNATMDRSLPQSVVPFLIGYRWEISPERNRVTVTLDLSALTPQMRHDLWLRYGDAVDVWLFSGQVLLEPEAWWAG